MSNIKHEFMGGTIISRAALELCAAANNDGQPHECDFNGITVVANPGDTGEDLVRRYHEASDRRAAEYRLLRSLDSLDWSTHHAPLRWWREFAEHADHVGVTFHRTFVTGTFNARGYAPGVNCGKAFNKADPDNVARWIVGQCLDMTEKVGSPHPVAAKFIAEWLDANRTEAA